MELPAPAESPTNANRLRRLPAGQHFAELDEIFIQPASAQDAEIRRRVEARYGRALAGG